MSPNKPKLVPLLLVLMMASLMLLYASYRKAGRVSGPADAGAKAKKALTDSMVSLFASPRPAASVIPVPAPPTSGVSEGYATRAEQWARFQELFGRNLRADIQGSGRINSIRGSGDPAPGGRFSPSREETVRHRAEAILRELRPLIGAPTAGGFAAPVISTGTTTAQVFYRQSMDGLMLEPFGSVTIQLGEDGELVGVASDYLESVQISNSRTLSPEEARTQAATRAQASPEDLGAGRPVLWTRTPTEAKHAYSFSARGRQIIIDAGTGDVILDRDRRRY